MRTCLAPVMRWGEPGGRDDRPLDHGRVDDCRMATLLARWEALQPLVPAPCSEALEEPPPASLRGSAQVGAPAVGAMSQIM